MRGARRLMALVVTVAVLGCAPASEMDLVGTWQIADWSREYVPEAFQEDAGRLTLAADGTFTAFELPVSVGQSVGRPWPAGGPWPAELKTALLTGSGTWKIDRAGGQVVRLRIKAASKGYSGIIPYGYLLSVHPAFGRHSRHSLVDFWGDPDAVPGIFYSRAEAEQEP